MGAKASAWTACEPQVFIAGAGGSRLIDRGSLPPGRHFVAARPGALWCRSDSAATVRCAVLAVRPSITSNKSLSERQTVEADDWTAPYPQAQRFLTGPVLRHPLARCLAEIFGSKSDEEVAAAEPRNYLPLLPGLEVDEPATIPRLGKKRVPRR